MKRATNHQNRTEAVGVGHGLRAGWGGVARAFTIIEATIVIGIIALLAGILLLAVSHAKKRGDVVAEQAMVTTLQKAVEKFKMDYGFPPPLVNDSAPGPVNLGTGRIEVWTDAELSGAVPAPNGGQRWSEMSLAYYLAGALEAPYDGIDGLGFTAPDRTGQFSKHGRKIDPLVDLTQQKTRLGTPRLYIQGLGGGGGANTRTICKILDRWSDASSIQLQYPIRYYRWKNEYYTDPALNLLTSAPSADLIGKVKTYNVPAIVGNPATRPELRDAEYAIISAGPDHLWGTADDIIEVGR